MKTQRHEHYECIIAWAEGKPIQIFDGVYGKWVNVDTPLWYPGNTYRIALEETVHVMGYELPKPCQKADTRHIEIIGVSVLTVSPQF